MNTIQRGNQGSALKWFFESIGLRISERILAYRFILLSVLGLLVMGSVYKFGWASMVIIPICFTAAFLIRKIPGVSKVL